jgi:hypothetical protein
MLAIPRVFPRRRTAGAVMRAGVKKHPVSGVLQEGSLHQGDQLGAVVVHDRVVVRSTNDMPDLPLIILGLHSKDARKRYAAVARRGAEES